MKLALHDSSNIGPVRRAASPYRVHVVPTWDDGIENLDLPRPWVVLELTDSSVPLGAVTFTPDMFAGTVFVGYDHELPLPQWLLDDADTLVYIEQFDDTPRVPQWAAAAIYLHAAFAAMRSR